MLQTEDSEMRTLSLGSLAMLPTGGGVTAVRLFWLSGECGNLKTCRPMPPDVLERHYVPTVGWNAAAKGGRP